MVLVDTSVWIRFLANRAPYAAELDRLLGLDEVTGHELVYGELLIGDRGGRREFLAGLANASSGHGPSPGGRRVCSRSRLAGSRCGLDRRSPSSVRNCGGDCSYGRPTHD